MAFNHYAEQVVADVATGRPLANQPVKLLDFETDQPVDAYIDGAVTILASGANGLVPPFQTLDTTRRVKLIIGSVEYSRWCDEMILRAVDAGIEQVSGAVTLDGTGDPIREFYTTGATTFTTNGNSTLISSMTAVVWRRDGAGVWGYKEVSGWTVPAADATAPTAGTLASSNLVWNGVRLTVSGASDAVALHASPYRFSTDNGSAWSAWQSPAFYDATSLSGSTTYTCKAEVRDAAGNTAQTASISVTTPAAPADTTAPTPGTLASSAVTSSGFTLTITGASDDVGLHATPYAFSTDNGATWSAYQSSASLAVTGKTASTAYQCIGRVSDAAGNTADTPMVSVSTTAVQTTVILTDDFTSTTASNTGQVWYAATGRAGGAVLALTSAGHNGVQHTANPQGMDIEFDLTPLATSTSTVVNFWGNNADSGNRAGAYFTPNTSGRVDFFGVGAASKSSGTHSYVVDTAIRVKIQIRGLTVTTFFDGVQKATATYAQGTYDTLANPTWLQFRNYNGSHNFDNLVVTDIQ